MQYVAWQRSCLYQEGKKQAIARLPGYAGLGAGPGYAVVASHSAKSGRTECAVFDVANKFAAFHHRCDPKQVNGGGGGAMVTRE